MAHPKTERKETGYARLFVKITRDILPRVSDRYPFIYLERGRLEIDGSSVKWRDSECGVIRLPVATISCLLLGPGTSVTHGAIKAAADANCSICWVGEDSLAFYAAGITPTANTRNLRRQAELSCDESARVAVARAMMRKRFPEANLDGKNLQELRTLEGLRVRNIYEQKARQYNVGWKGRRYEPGKFELADVTNKILTALNHMLYGVVASCVHSLGYSPHLGFIHSGGELPFVYDIADLHKQNMSVDLAFALTFDMAGEYNRYKVIEAFRERAMELELLKSVVDDLENLLGEKSVSRYRK